MNIHAQVALEWWRAGTSSEKTLARLDSLVEHECKVYAIKDRETIEAIKREAQNGIRDWEIAKYFLGA